MENQKDVSRHFQRNSIFIFSPKQTMTAASLALPEYSRVNANSCIAGDYEIAYHVIVGVNSL